MPLGTLTIAPGTLTREGKRQRVKATCSACGETWTLDAHNLYRGLTTTCRCQRNRKYPEQGERLGERYDAMMARCHNPNSEWFPAYGGRGIKVKFSSREAFVFWALENLPHPNYKGVQIDRIDNNGHYEPGNLRLVSAKVNMRNRQASRRVLYLGQCVNVCDLWHLLKTDFTWFQLGYDRTVKLATLGVPVYQIVQKKARGKRPGSTTLSTPDPAIVSLYRGS